MRSTVFDLFRRLQLRFNKTLAVTDIPPRDYSPQNFFIHPQYRSRLTPQYFDDLLPGTEHKVFQPDVYSLAAVLASRGGNKIIDLGCGKGEKLQALAQGYEVVGVDLGANIDYCKKVHTFGRWIEHDLETDLSFPFTAVDLQNCIMICSDVIEHIVNPLSLLRNLKASLDQGALVLLSTPERDLARGRGDRGPPANLAHAREWTMGELRALLLQLGFPIHFLGLTANNSVDRKMTTIIAVLAHQGRP